MRRVRVTLPLHYRYITVTVTLPLWASRPQARYIPSHTVTLPSHYRQITVTLPSHYRYITVTLPLHQVIDAEITALLRAGEPLVQALEATYAQLQMDDVRRA